MTLITLVRRGQTVWHREDRYVGSSDVALAPRGRSQAALLARWAAIVELTSILSSDLSRARVTAEECTAATGLSFTIDPRLRELNLGQVEGLTRAEMRARFPEEHRAFKSDPVTQHFPGGENPVLAADRFTAALHDATAADPHGHVLVIAHSTAIRLALCRLLGIPLRSYRRAFPSLGNCTLTTLRHKHGRTGLLRYNSPLKPH
jgi:broad specificity phosphatase PhoE